MRACSFVCFADVAYVGVYVNVYVCLSVCVCACICVCVCTVCGPCFTRSCVFVCSCTCARVCVCLNAHVAMWFVLLLCFAFLLLPCSMGEQAPHL